MSSYLSGTATVGTDATLICTVPDENDGVLVQNNGSDTVYLGGPNVAATGADQGVGLATGASLTVPSVGGTKNDLYGIVASGTADVAWLLPEL